MRTTTRVLLGHFDGFIRVVWYYDYVEGNGIYHVHGSGRGVADLQKSTLEEALKWVEVELKFERDRIEIMF